MKARRIEPTLRLVRTVDATDVRLTWAAAQAAGVQPTRVPVELDPWHGSGTSGCSLCAGAPCAVPQACGLTSPKRYLARDLMTLVLGVLVAALTAACVLALLFGIPR